MDKEDESATVLEADTKQRSEDCEVCVSDSDFKSVVMSCVYEPNKSSYQSELHLLSLHHVTNPVPKLLI
jgi:hypothetical protein